MCVTRCGKYMYTLLFVSDHGVFLLFQRTVCVRACVCVRVHVHMCTLHAVLHVYVVYFIILMQILPRMTKNHST